MPTLTGRTWGKGTQRAVVEKRILKLEEWLCNVLRLSDGFPVIRSELKEFLSAIIYRGVSLTAAAPPSAISTAPPVAEGPRGRLRSISGTCAQCHKPLGPDSTRTTVKGMELTFCSKACSSWYEHQQLTGIVIDKGSGVPVLTASPSASERHLGMTPPGGQTPSPHGNCLARVSRPSLDPGSATSRRLLEAAGAAATMGATRASTSGAKPATGSVRVLDAQGAATAAPAAAMQASRPPTISKPHLVGATTATTPSGGSCSAVSVRVLTAPQASGAATGTAGGADEGSRHPSSEAGQGAAAARSFSLGGWAGAEGVPAAHPGPSASEGRRRTLLDSFRRQSTPARSAAVGVVQRGGHLWKRGGFRGGRQNWKRRYFCLVERSLRYYDDRTPTLLGVMPLAGSTTDLPAALGGGAAFYAEVATLPKEQLRKLGLPAKLQAKPTPPVSQTAGTGSVHQLGADGRAGGAGPWAFQVRTPDRTLVLCAESALDRDTWMDAITDAVQRCRATDFEARAHAAGRGSSHAASPHPAGTPTPASVAQAHHSTPPFATMGPSSAGSAAQPEFPEQSPYPQSPSLYTGSPASQASPTRPVVRPGRQRLTLLDVRHAGSRAVSTGTLVAAPGHPGSPDAAGPRAAEPWPPTAVSGPEDAAPIITGDTADTLAGADRRHASTSGSGGGAAPRPLSPPAAQTGDERRPPVHEPALSRPQEAGSSPADAGEDASALANLDAVVSAGPAVGMEPPPSPPGHLEDVPRFAADHAMPPRDGIPHAVLERHSSAGPASTVQRPSIASLGGALAAAAAAAAAATVSAGTEVWGVELSSSTWEVSETDIEVTERIGEGAFGDVFRGRLWGTDVAIKLVKDNSAAELGSDALKALRAEVSILSQLRHPNIVLYLGAGTTPPSVFVVTEWCERGDLNDLLYDPSAPLSAAARVRLALHVAQGMTYLHSPRRGIVHRDLKSQNLLITRHYVLKVADFGLTIFQTELAKTAKAAANPDERAAAAFGADAVGTPQWMAPEVLEGERYNEKVDVFSFGVVLSELCARVQPYADRYKRWDFVEAVLEEGAAPTMPLWADPPQPTADPITAENRILALEAHITTSDAQRHHLLAPQEPRPRSLSQGSDPSPSQASESILDSACASRQPSRVPASTSPANSILHHPATPASAATATTPSPGRGSNFAHLSLSDLSDALKEAATDSDASDDSGREPSSLPAPPGFAGASTAATHSKHALSLAAATSSFPTRLPWTRTPIWWNNDSEFCDAMHAATVKLQASDCPDDRIPLPLAPSADGGVGSTLAFHPFPTASPAPCECSTRPAAVEAELRAALAARQLQGEGERYASATVPAASIPEQWQLLPGRAEEWRCTIGESSGVLQLLASACLSRDPDKRPAFEEVADLLGALLSSTQNSIFVELEVPRLREELAYGSPEVQLRSVAELSHIATHALLAAAASSAAKGSDTGSLWAPGYGLNGRLSSVPDTLWSAASLPFAFSTKLGYVSSPAQLASAAFAAEPRSPVATCDLDCLRIAAPQLIAGLAGMLRTYDAGLRCNLRLPGCAPMTADALHALHKLSLLGVFTPGADSAVRRTRTSSGTGLAQLVGDEAAATGASVAGVFVERVKLGLPAVPDKASLDARSRGRRRKRPTTKPGPLKEEVINVMAAGMQALAVVVRASGATAGGLGFGSDNVREALLPSLGRLAHALASVAADGGKNFGADIKALAAVLLACCWEACPDRRSRSILTFAVAHTLAHAVAQFASSPGQASARCEATLTLLLSDSQASLHGDHLRDACQAVLSAMFVFEA